MWVNEMDLKIIFAWFFLITTTLSMVGLTFLLVFLLIIGIFHPLFILYIIHILMGILMIIILGDYISIKRKEAKHMGN